MMKWLLVGCLVSPTLGGAAVADDRKLPIDHTVFFELKHAPGSEAERAFLDRLEALASIPGVEQFRTVREISDRNPFRFGALMRFADAAAYEAYGAHPDHVRFLREVWVPGVSQFQEIDFVAR